MKEKRRKSREKAVAGGTVTQCQIVG